MKLAFLIFQASVRYLAEAKINMLGDPSRY